jgi:serine/threonine protein kinase
MSHMIQIEYLSEADLDGFKIDLSKPEKGSNEFFQYYSVINSHTQQHYTIVAFINEIPSNAKWIRVLNKERPLETIAPEKFGLVTFEEYDVTLPIAIFKPIDYSTNLQAYVKQNGPLSLELITQKLLPSLIKLLNIANRYNLAYGNIAPENILITNNGNFVLRECFAGINFQVQQRCFIAPELIDCPEFASARSSANDLYAFGVTLYYAATGDCFWDAQDVGKYNALRLQNGTLPLLKQLKKLPPFLAQIIIGLVSNVSSRFDLESFLAKLDQKNNDRYGKQHNLVEQEIKIYFNNKECLNFQFLAHELFSHWQAALRFVQEDNTLKYLLEKKNRPDLEGSNLPHLNSQSKLKTLLQIIDPHGPIRSDGFAICLWAVPDALTCAYISKDKEFLAKIIGVVADWLNLTKYLAMDLGGDMSIVLKNASSIYDSKDTFFGIERLLYMTNKYLHCLSEVIFAQRVLTLEGCLTLLEEKIQQDKFELDNHLIAFMADRLGLSNVMMQSQRYSDIAQAPSLKFIYLLALAQKTLPNIKIVNLCKYFVSDIIEKLDNSLYNLDTKSKISKSLIRYAENSQAGKIFEAAINQKLHDQDDAGFTIACQKIQYLNRQILKLENQSMEAENLLFDAQKVTVVFSYLICLIISLVIII